MTTPYPMEDIGMPYAGTLIPQSGATVLQIVEHHRNRNGSGASTIFEVPDGVSMITATWDGPQGANVDLRSNADGSRRTVARINPGIGPRSSNPVTVSTFATGDGIQIYLDSIPTASHADRRGSIAVIPFPTP